MTEYTPTTVRLTSEDREELREFAEQQNRTESEIVREAVHLHIFAEVPPYFQKLKNAVSDMAHYLGAEYRKEFYSYLRSVLGNQMLILMNQRTFLRNQEESEKATQVNDHISGLKNLQKELDDEIDELEAEIGEMKEVDFHDD